MKAHLLIISLLLTLLSGITHAQNNTDTIQQTLRIGVKNTTLDLNQDNINYLDAFEYEVSLLLKNYLEEKHSFNLEFVKISQADRVDEISSGESIDVLLYSFSKTKDREEKGIEFSNPYFQNQAIILASRDKNLTINDFGKKNLKIGYIINTTGDEVTKIRDQYIGTITVEGFDSYNSMLESLKNGRIDAITGDVSRMASELASREVYFGGNLPTPKAKIRDNYSIAISPDKPELKPLINSFIRENSTLISHFNSKWFATSIEQVYSEFYSDKDRNTTLMYIFGLASIVLAFVCFFMGLIYFYQKRELRKRREDGNEYAIQEFNDFFKQELNTKEIIEAGVRIFNRAQNDILYVGSAGFMAAGDKLKNEWSLGIDSFLNKSGRNVIFDRIIDLPKFDFENKSFIELSTKQIPPTNVDSNNPKDYVELYIRWLLMQYHNLIFYNREKSDTYNIYDSRAAALWGAGIVIIIKDSGISNNENKSEGVYFTTYGGENIGAKIFASDLACQWGKSIRQIKKQDHINRLKPENRTYLSADKMKAIFFDKHDLLRKASDTIKEKVSVSKVSVLSDPEIKELIDTTAHKFNNWFKE